MAYQSNLKSVISGGGGAADWNSLTGKPFSSLAEADFMVDDDGMLFLNPALSFLRNGVNDFLPIEIFDTSGNGLVVSSDYGVWLEYFGAKLGLADPGPIPIFDDGQSSHEILYSGMQNEAHLNGSLRVEGASTFGDTAEFSNYAYFYGNTSFNGNETSFFSDSYFYNRFTAVNDTYLTGNVTVSGVANFNNEADFYSYAYFYSDVRFNLNTYFYDNTYFYSYATFSSDVNFSGDLNVNGSANFGSSASFGGSAYFYGELNANYAAYFNGLTIFYNYALFYSYADFDGLVEFRNHVYFQDTTTLYSNVILGAGVKLLATRGYDGAQEVLIALGEYGSYEQTEVGSEARPTCLNHNSVSSDGTDVGKNIIVNWKNGSGEQQTDAVAYLSDVPTPTIDMRMDGGRIYLKINGSVSHLNNPRINLFRLKKPNYYDRTHMNPAWYRPSYKHLWTFPNKARDQIITADDCTVNIPEGYEPYNWFDSGKTVNYLYGKLCEEYLRPDTGGVEVKVHAIKTRRASVNLNSPGGEGSTSAFVPLSFAVVSSAGQGQYPHVGEKCKFNLLVAIQRKQGTTFSDKFDILKSIRILS